MLRVIEIRRDGSAVVDTRGLRRIVSQPGGRVLVEFARAANAANLVKLYNDGFPSGEHWAESIAYPALYRRRSSGGPKVKRPRRKAS